MRVLAIALAGCASATFPGPTIDRDDPDAATVSVTDAATVPAADAATVPAADAATVPAADAVATCPAEDFAELTGDFAGLGAYLHVPPGLVVGVPHPLILVLHGCEEDARVHATDSGWDTFADVRGWLVAFADERAQPAHCLDWWSAAAQSGGGETAGALATVDAVRGAYPVSTVHVAGFDAGAAMAVDLLATSPDRFDGAILFATMPVAASLTPRAYPPIVAFIGDRDTTSPTDTLVQQWTGAQGADATADFTGTLDPADSHHTYREYRAPDGRLVIATVTIAGMGHGYPVAPPDGDTAAHLAGAPAFGLDIGLWGAYWGAAALGW